MKTNYQYLLRALLICSALFLLCETAIAESEKLNFRWRANVVVKQYNDRDTDAEIRFGRNLAARILSKYQLWQNEKAQKYVQLIGTATASQSMRVNHYKVSFLKG
ncbi:MAG: putative Zn-dependent protease [bacterium]|jgi:predicted Zn-dependent protease